MEEEDGSSQQEDGPLTHVERQGGRSELRGWLGLESEHGADLAGYCVQQRAVWFL
jgi:hypothetical protein